MSAEPQVASPSDDAQQQSVRRLLEAVIRNAEADVDRVAAFLAARGLKRRPPSEPAAPIYRGPAGPAGVFLLGLAAALRLHDWDRGGLRPHLPPDLPSADQALADTVEAIRVAMRAAGGGQAAAMPGIPSTVFRTWFRHFAHSGRTDLGADVFMDVGDDGGFLDELAAVLWAHRRIARRPGEVERRTIRDAVAALRLPEANWKDVEHVPVAVALPELKRRMKPMAGAFQRGSSPPRSRRGTRTWRSFAQASCRTGRP